MMISITRCPNCGSPAIRQVSRDWQGEACGEAYTARDLKYHDCPECGERVFDREAMRRIEASSPAFAKPVRRSA